MPGLRGDRGDIAIGWFTKIVIALALLGIVGYEATSIGVAHVQTQDLAKDAAREASREWQRTKDVQRAFDAAEVRIGTAGTVDPNEFHVKPDGSVMLTVEREADSLVLYRFGATKKWTEVRETAQTKWIA